MRKLHPSFKHDRPMFFIHNYYGGAWSEEQIIENWSEEYAQGKLFADQDPSLKESPFTPVPKITTPPNTLFADTPRVKKDELFFGVDRTTSSETPATPSPKVVKERHELPNGFALYTSWSQEHSKVWFELMACQGFPGFPFGSDLSLKDWFDGALTGDEARDVIRTTIEKLRGMLGG